MMQNMLKITKEQEILWATKPVRDSSFTFTIEGTVKEPDSIYSKSILAHHAGVEKNSYNNGPAFAPEWGYSFTHLGGQKDGMGRTIEAGYSVPPKTRKEALEVIRAFLMKQYIKDAPHPWISMNGHYPWHHYAGEFGFDMLCSEIGENINNYQWHIALNRGAAKQYQLPWSIDFSAWYGPSVTDYSEQKHWKEYSSPDGGHSMSLLERSYYMAYMAGAGEVVAESGRIISFYDDTDEAGIRTLSPYGQVGKSFYDFTCSNPDRGICYVPFGVVLDYYHGAYSGFDGKKAFYHFHYNKGDEMTWNLINMIWPGGWEVQGHNEIGTMVNGPYGDNYDILLQNAPEELLKTYPCLILSGAIRFKKKEVEKFERYVKQGGTLLLNRAYLKYFPLFADMDENADIIEAPCGNGTVVIYGNNYEIDGIEVILSDRIKKLIPFSIAGNVQYMVNVCKDRLLLTLINNDGVTKDYLAPPEIDSKQVISFSVTYTGIEQIKQMTDLKSGRVYTAHDNKINITMEPGSVAVLEIKSKASGESLQ